MAKLVAKLKESLSEITTKVLNFAKKFFESKLTRTSNRILPHIKNAIKRAIVEQPEYRALSNPGVLSAHFGLSHGNNDIEAIIDHWISQIYIRKNPVHVQGKTLTGGLEIMTPPPQVLLEHPKAKVITEKGQELPWLEWLLFRGSSEIIYGYRIQTGVYPGSRSGQAYMLKDIHGSWGVPEGFQGTETDNFILIAIVEVKPRIDGILQEYLNK